MLGLNIPFISPSLGLNIPCPATGYQPNPLSHYRTESKLSFFFQKSLCDPVGIRTQDPQLRRLLLYPAELPDHPLMDFRPSLRSHPLGVFTHGSATQNIMHGHSPRNLRMQRYAFSSNHTNKFQNIFLGETIFVSKRVKATQSDLHSLL